jgi:transcriptional regulator with XRE-family HTH domain
VPSAPHSPIVRRRRLGAQLRRLREAAGLTGEQVIHRLGWASASKLSRLENGRSRPDLGDVLDLLDLYAVGPKVRAELMAITRDAGDVRQWLRSYPVMTRRQRGYAELEAGSVQIREYSPALVPGLLQTPEYARMRILSCRPLLGLPANGRDPDDPETEVAARLARQSLLTRDNAPPAYAAVLEEAALISRGGPPHVVRGQLAHLRERAALPNVTLQVLPRDARIADWYVPHIAFSIYRYAHPDDPAALAIEGLTTDLVSTGGAELDRYALVFDWLRAAALTPEETLTWLADAAARSTAAPTGPQLPPQRDRHAEDRRDA